MKSLIVILYLTILLGCTENRDNGMVYAARLANLKEICIKIGIELNRKAYSIVETDGSYHCDVLRKGNIPIMYDEQEVKAINRFLLQKANHE